ncbi:peptidylprolyl isomerase [Ferrovibrio sp.]|uniref:foldase protein PrsA n=1 Tax=Ferrovibrio sp. TaxID=1917215 RepID=UPI001B5E901D|nr:peptidylprolyl isomerase [Ferrovibrio sp.]MBP7063566.1 peptidylprolyl isomerase [Ferrovibrio sp.]
MFHFSASRVALIALPVIALAGIALAQPASDPVVARVNGQPITRSQVMAVFESLPPQMRQAPLEAVMPALINEMVARKLINEAAEKAKLDGDAKVKEQLKSARETVLQQAFLERTVSKELTDERLKKRYDDLIKAQPPRDEVHARHILVANEVDALAALEDVKKGQDFGEVSKKRSTGPTAATGGDLGFFTKDQMVPEFAEAAFALQPGQVTQKPVKSQFGWHVIKVEARRTAPPPAFADVSEEVREILVREIIEQTVNDLKKGAKIDIVEQPKPAGQLPTIAPAPKK